MTGSFDDWKKTEKLEKVGDHFEKKVQLPDSSSKIEYKVRYFMYAPTSPLSEPVLSFLSASIPNRLHRYSGSHQVMDLEHEMSPGDVRVGLGYDRSRSVFGVVCRSLQPPASLQRAFSSHHYRRLFIILN